MNTQNKKDARWVQRFSNDQKAFLQKAEFVNNGQLSSIEKQRFIQLLIGPTE